MVKLTIDDVEVEATEEETILTAARRAGIYIPALCAHPDLPPAPGRKASKAVFINGELMEGTNEGKEFEGCRLCIVQIEGRQGFHLSCSTPVAEGMIVYTNTSELRETRRDELAKILAKHPHACLICPQREGCSLTECSSDVPKEERCCSKFNNCELRKFAEYVGIRPDIPRYTFRNLPVVKEEPLFFHDYNLCIGCLRCLRVCRDVRGVDALDFVYRDGEILIGTTAPSREEAGCRFCGACVEVCPTGALEDKVKKAIPEEALVPCRFACPAGVDVPRYVRLISEGKFAEAAAVIREKVPFPAVLGRVCPHPCEEVCRRNELNEPVSICALKRFAAEHDSGLWKANFKIAPPSGRKLAIIGSGPAGLTAAYYLAKLGHSVTVFEALPYPGGMMRVGIPHFRLPKDVLDKEIAEIRNLGVEIRTNVYIESLEEFFQQGYEAIFVAVGAHQSAEMNIEGEKESGVFPGIELLRRVNTGELVQLGNRVVVIGGGNVATDAARAAGRLGANKVSILYRRTRAEMLASQEEVEEALTEGVELHFLTAPIRITRENEQLHVECIRMKLAEPDESGRARPIPIEGSEFTTEFDNVIMAIGQLPKIPKGWELKRGKNGIIEVDRDTLATSREGVFAGGDAVSGPASVIEAIAMGKKAAASIDKYLGGEGMIEKELVKLAPPSSWLGQEKGFAARRRVQVPCLPLNQHLREFDEVKLGFIEDEAVKEAKRCLRCDLRLQISPPLLPPEEWLEFEAKNVGLVPEVEGVYQLLDESKNIIYIKGAMNLRRELEEQLSSNEQARYFKWEEEPMYTRRESELLQQFLQQHAQLPSQNLGLEDLFN